MPVACPDSRTTDTPVRPRRPAPRRPARHRPSRPHSPPPAPAPPSRRAAAPPTRRRPAAAANAAALVAHHLPQTARPLTPASLPPGHRAFRCGSGTAHPPRRWWVVGANASPWAAVTPSEAGSWVTGQGHGRRGRCGHGAVDRCGWVVTAGALATGQPLMVKGAQVASSTSGTPPAPTAAKVTGLMVTPRLLQRSRHSRVASDPQSRISGPPLVPSRAPQVAGVPGRDRRLDREVGRQVVYGVAGDPATAVVASTDPPDNRASSRVRPCSATAVTTKNSPSVTVDP